MGHASLDLAQPRSALASYEKALCLREKLEAPDSPPIADVCDSIACAYTEAGDVDRALAQLEKATAIHEAHDPSKMARTLAIRAMTYLRAGRADEALDAICECWRLQDMTQGQIEASKYPRHSGDVMLLSRIFWLQGRKAEARELASRTVALRRGIYGENGGPRVADSLFTVARMLEASGELVLAARLLREIVDMSGDAPGMRTHLARALWFSASVEAKIGRCQDEVANLREKAQESRSRVEENEWPDEDSEEGFMRLVSWMLW